jgi:hypothetical protein
MSVVIARSVSDEAICKGPCLNRGERLLPPIYRGRNDMLIRELAMDTAEANILIGGPRIKACLENLKTGVIISADESYEEEP